VAGVLATLLVIGWVDIIRLVVDGAGTLAAAASTLPIPSEMLLAVGIVVVFHVISRSGPRRV
jgi:hypothetical protein